MLPVLRQSLTIRDQDETLMGTTYAEKFLKLFSKTSGAGHCWRQDTGPNEDKSDPVWQFLCACVYRLWIMSLCFCLLKQTHTPHTTTLLSGGNGRLLSK